MEIIDRWEGPYAGRYEKYVYVKDAFQPPVIPQLVGIVCNKCGVSYQDDRFTRSEHGLPSYYALKEQKNIGFLEHLQSGNIEKFYCSCRCGLDDKDS